MNDFQQNIEELARQVAQRNRDLPALLGAAADLIVESKRLVAFTGAGVSTESGIPDFRSPGGVWTRLNPSDWTFQRFLSDPKTRRQVWQRYRTNQMRQAQPNAAHYAIAELYRLEKLDCVITQNVDGLHQEAGVPPELVLELHGTNKYVVCLSCAQRYTREEILARLEAGEEIPLCHHCGGLLKSATISFGQAMPEQVTAEATYRSMQCDLMLVVGSTLVVYPAAYMPQYALDHGAKLVIINLMETPLDDRAHLRLWAKAGEVLPQIVERVKGSLLERVPRRCQP